MATYREEVAERIAPMLAPIAGANPAGADVSYDPDFESVKAEIDKLSSVEGLEPSWVRIQELGTTLLAKKSKDLRIVSWMTVAKAKTDTWRGFAEALLLYDGLARNFWDQMYPEARRARARLNAIAWMADMVHQHLESADVSLSDGDAVRTCDETLNALDALLAEKLGDQYAGPGQLRSLMRNKVAAIPEPPPEGSTDEAAPGAATDPFAGEFISGPTQTTAATPTSAEDVKESVRGSGKALIAGAAVLREADPARAWAYTLQRLGAWLDLEEAPPATDGRIDASPPPYEVTQELNELRDAQKWPELLKAAESRVAEYPMWIDLQRMVASAMDQLGPMYKAAREAVGRETLHLLGRLPALLTLSFNDGVRLADAATETWIQGESRKWGGGVGFSEAARAAAAEEEGIAARLAEAQAMVGAGRVADGLAVALALADRSPDARLRFRARLAVGKMALDGAKPELARPLLEHLLVDVERHGLETWEPALCATLYAYLFAATREVSRAKGDSPDLVAKADHLFDKLCRLDPASAIRLSTA